MHHGRIRLLAAAMVVIAAGCASYGGSNLVPGKSTAAEVEASMGKPADRINLPGGDSVWYYPRGSAARQTFAVRLGPNGVVRDVSQIRTIQNLAKLEIGKSTRDDVKAILGSPDRITTMTRIQRTVWDYDMYEDTRAVIVYVQFDPAGRVREVLQVDDPAFQNLGAPSM
jgi:outer membrane protein assembly factor BamE (lipoprotein component of BamABCDE complex)